MQQSTTTPAPRQPFDEADIGSGEPSPGQHDTEKLIRQIPPLPDRRDGGEAPPSAPVPAQPA